MGSGSSAGCTTSDPLPANALRKAAEDGPCIHVWDLEEDPGFWLAHLQKLWPFGELNQQMGHLYLLCCPCTFALQINNLF